ncbi:MAG: alpha-2-macroglobulin family protein [Myxococcales bacterium]
MPFKYVFSVRAVDDERSQAGISHAFHVAQCKVLGAVSPSARVVHRGQPVSLAVRATSLGGKPLAKTRGTLALSHRGADGVETALGQEPLETDEQGVWRTTVSSDRVGTLLAHVTLEDERRKTWTGETQVLVAEGGEAVAQVSRLTLDALRQTVEPGEKAELIALFPDGWGSGLANEGPVWLTFSGAEVYRTELLDFRGRTLVHAFEVERRFSSGVWVSVAYPGPDGRWEEQTVPFRVLPRERALRVAVLAQVPEARPFGHQELSLVVTDHQGRPAQAQVSVGVVDKAVYALQSELRPDVLQFFYPLGRNNVTSFYSSEFQGYGYGEKLARELSLQGGYAFAAIKPPTRRKKDDERDTAYWTPGVLTDSEGRARVRFELPSNQTQWVVTAVAADAAGRFGEGRTEFGSRGEVQVVSSAPAYLRSGDSAVASVRVSRGPAAGGQPGKDVLLQAGGVFLPATAREELKLSKAGEQVVRIALDSRGPGVGELGAAVSGKTPVATRRAIVVRPASIEEPMESLRWGAGTLGLEAPAGAELTEQTLTLSPSLLAAALVAARDLLEYPHGCVEQLVATTVPNLAILRTLERIGALEKLDPQTQALLAEARSRAVLGVHRIEEHAVKGGGFAWYGRSEPSVPMTLVALDGLAYAVEAGLASAADEPIARSVGWVEAQKDLTPGLEAMRALVLARLQGRARAGEIRALAERVPADDPFGSAMLLLAARSAGMAEETNLAQRAAALAKSINVLPRPDRPIEVIRPEWTLAGSDARTMPVRRVGLVALLADASQRELEDVSAVRRTLIEALARRDLSTLDRSLALLHSLWLLERDARELRRSPAPKVLADGLPVLLQERGAGWGTTVSRTVRRVEIGPFEGVASLRATATVPLDQVRPMAGARPITRRYWRLTHDGAELLEPGASVAQGAEVFVELLLSVEEETRPGTLQSAYSVVQDSLPAGFSPVTEDKPWRGGPWKLPLAHQALRRRELEPDKATFYLEVPSSWSEAPRRLGYVMRADFVGRFVVPPASWEDMYDARSRSRTGVDFIEVRAP